MKCRIPRDVHVGEALDHTLDQKIYAFMLQIVDSLAFDATGMSVWRRSLLLGKKLLFLFVQGLLPSFTSSPDGKTGGSPQDQLPTTGGPHAIVIVRPTRVGVLVSKEGVGVLIVVHVRVIPGDRLFVEPCAIEPMFDLAKATTGPFFTGRWRRNVHGCERGSGQRSPCCIGSQPEEDWEELWDRMEVSPQGQDRRVHRQGQQVARVYCVAGLLDHSRLVHHQVESGPMAMGFHGLGHVIGIGAGSGFHGSLTLTRGRGAKAGGQRARRRGPNGCRKLRGSNEVGKQKGKDG